MKVEQLLGKADKAVIQDEKSLAEDDGSSPGWMELICLQWSQTHSFAMSSARLGHLRECYSIPNCPNHKNQLEEHVENTGFPACLGSILIQWV